MHLPIPLQYTRSTWPHPPYGQPQQSIHVPRGHNSPIRLPCLLFRQTPSPPEHRHLLFRHNRHESWCALHYYFIMVLLFDSPGREETAAAPSSPRKNYHKSKSELFPSPVVAAAVIPAPARHPPRSYALPTNNIHPRRNNQKSFTHMRPGGGMGLSLSTLSRPSFSQTEIRTVRAFLSTPPPHEYGLTCGITTIHLAWQDDAATDRQDASKGNATIISSSSFTPQALRSRGRRGRSRQTIVSQKKRTNNILVLRAADRRRVS